MGPLTRKIPAETLVPVHAKGSAQDQSAGPSKRQFVRYRVEGWRLLVVHLSSLVI